MKRKLSKRKLMANARSEMTEEAYFESKSFYEHLLSMFKFMTRCEKEVVIHILNMNNEMTAGTDGKVLFLNWNSPIQSTFPTFKLKVQSVMGMFYHEVGHMLYTDFDTTNNFCGRMRNEGKLTLKVDSVLKQEKEDLAYFLEIRPQYRDYITKTFHNIMNIVEDIWMESKICQEFEGTVKDAVTINRIKLLDDCPTLKKMIDKEYSETAITINLILCYASSGIIPNPHQFETVHTEVLELAKPYINQGISCEDVWGRIIQSVNILLCMWQMIQSEIEEKEEEQKEQRKNSRNEQNSEIESTSDSKHQENAQESQNSSGKEQSQIAETIAEALLQHQKQEVKESSDVNEEAQTSEYYRGKRAETQEVSNGTNTLGNEDFDNSGVVSGENANDSDESWKGYAEQEKNGESKLSQNMQQSREKIRQMIADTPRFSETQGSADGDLDQGGKIQYENLEFSTNDGIGAMIEKSISNCAEEIVNRKLLKENQQELVREVQDVPFTDNHKGVNFRVRRHISVNKSDISNYSQLKGILRYSKALQKALEETLKRKPAGIYRRQWVGKGIDKNNLYDKQQKVFYKKNIPEENNLAVSILIDESGSMGNRKIAEAIRMTVILEDFCRNFNIPLSIAGHNWSDCVEYDVYKDFDDIDGRDKYRLMQITSKGCNRDGAALQFCGEHLLKRPEDKKLLILISDGQPNAGAYCGEVAKADLKSIKKNLKNRGVELFAAAIDDDKEYIKAIYGNGFLDMSDLSKLPKTMVRLVESFMAI